MKDVDGSTYYTGQLLVAIVEKTRTGGRRTLAAGPLNDIDQQQRDRHSFNGIGLTHQTLEKNQVSNYMAMRRGNVWPPSSMTSNLKENMMI